MTKQIQFQEKKRVRERRRRKGEKNVFPCEKWSCRLKEWVCFIYFFFACDAKQMTWKLLHYCHMCENEGISAQPLHCMVGWARFCKSHMGNVYCFALNRSCYCVAAHTSRKKGKKGLRLILNSFGKETSFHGKSTWKHSSRKTVVKSFGSFNLVLTCVQIQHKSISVIPALILLEHWTSVFPTLHSEG